jgi:hypothetical protein
MITEKTHDVTNTSVVGHFFSAKKDPLRYNMSRTNLYFFAGADICEQPIIYLVCAVWIFFFVIGFWL